MVERGAVEVAAFGGFDDFCSFRSAALQIDLNRHILENIRVSNNIDDGLGIVYSDLYSFGTSNLVKNCEFVDNLGSGISIKQFGLKVTGTKREFKGGE